MTSEDSFFINSASSIISHLSLLVKSKSLVTAQLEDNDSFLTTLIEINKEHKAIIFDYGPKEAVNQKVLKAPKIQFNTEFQGMQVAFSGSKITRIKYDGEQAFMMPLPNSIFWREQRQYFRAKSPLSKESYCRFLLPDQTEPVQLKLHDLSLAGFSVRVYSSDLAELLISEDQAQLLVPGYICEQATLILDQNGEDKVSFEICYNDIINPNKVNKIQRLGCKFAHIPPAFESNIQRYMQQIQREELQKKD